MIKPSFTIAVALVFSLCIMLPSVISAGIDGLNISLVNELGDEEEKPILESLQDIDAEKILCAEKKENSSDNKLNNGAAFISINYNSHLKEQISPPPEFS